ncbi:protein of unknown function DUF239 [Macleaya cordata]|uniref:Neprosin PEP catalytic domain-containing protein n=1 Tax=Macleaya cordata TaxID=56857 RepID=A0A200Q0V0_MACCD|nr:protein of unknown function DUF239 [Macleaya cordata]
MGTSKGIIFKLFVVVFCFSLNNYGSEGGRIGISKEEDTELERQLKILNKPPIKTFHTEWGDIIDCIDIHKQPAFDHPALKNHKIQMKPTFSPKRMITEKTLNVLEPEPSNIRIDGIECPEGTVPIRRTTKEDLIRAKSFSKTTNSSNFDNPSERAISAVIILENEDQGIKYFGASAEMYTYNPSVGEDQFSAAQFWIESGPTIFPLNSIQAGWIVTPQLYKDHLTRLFTYWTGNGSSVTGCYNTLCPGFVQIDPQILPSSPVDHTSTYGGKQYALNVYVSQAKTGDWWLITAHGRKIGYWPKALFNGLSEGADRLKWGGSVSLSEGGISPPMGSGHFPDGLPSHSCYITGIMYTGQHEELMNLGNSSVVGEINCKLYDLHNWGFIKGVGNAIEVGGPGGKCR